MTCLRVMKKSASALTSFGAARLPGCCTRDGDCRWLEAFRDMAQNRSVYPASQLALLYVANEILTKCSKYGVPEFKDTLKPFVTEAVCHLRPGHMIPKLSKLFNYWSHHKIFEPKFVQQLLNNIAPYGQDQSKGYPVSSAPDTEEAAKNFNPETLIESLRKLKKLEDELDDAAKPDVGAIYVDHPIASIVSSLKSKNESRALSQQVSQRLMLNKVIL
ncbi:unnamed protein product [Echinostoma caproni]|uniref:CID domain-containing protein n=1 Tax=Echinostoma caproni TaxID=27848 RepID=A0A183BC21_9TREM|nr:unnamed protein product [Echinostoma caproni]